MKLIAKYKSINAKTTINQGIKNADITTFEL